MEENKKIKIDLYTILFIILSLCVVVGPIIFLIFGTNRVEGQDGKFTNPTERHYIISVCVVTLIVCGSLLILGLTSKIKKIMENKKQKLEGIK